jgi:hypothetical protein
VVTGRDPRELLRRLEAHDATLWPPGNVSRDRLGWLEVAREMEREARELRRWAETIDQDRVVLLGMGGSSLGPAVLGAFAEAFAEWRGRRIVVCDTTDPDTVAATPIEDAFVLVSSKSGTTLETEVLFAAARQRLRDLRRYAVITDPGTPLAREADSLGVNRIFVNRPDIGGRYSVLSYFGLVPAALAGYDVAELCGRALDIDRLEAVELGLAMADAALEGRDKATIRTDERARPFGLWVEQLIAESTGKQGRGIVPVPTSDDEDGDDRFHLPVSFDAAHELGGAFARFEVATAVAGHVLRIDPFDEPNVAESKANTSAVLAKLPLEPPPAAEVADVEDFLAATLRPGDYVAIQAYLPYGSEERLEAARRAIRDRHGGLAVTAGYGPRFLHSTGQLHKGGPDSVVALQVVARAHAERVPIPGRPYDFATLIDAQAIGDYQSLVHHGRRVLRVAASDPGELA